MWTLMLRLLMPPALFVLVTWAVKGLMSICMSVEQQNQLNRSGVRHWHAKQKVESANNHNILQPCRTEAITQRCGLYYDGLYYDHTMISGAGLPTHKE